MKKPPPDRDDTSGPTDNPMSDAERMRRYRERKKVGARVVTLYLPSRVVARLIEWEWLSVEEDAEDPRRLVEEICDLLDLKVRDNFKSGPTRRPTALGLVVTGTATSS